MLLYLRRRLSSAVMHANVKCLLERLVLVGEGQGQAGTRREEEQARMEREHTGWRKLLAELSQEGVTFLNFNA